MTCILKKRILPVFLAFCISAGVVGTCQAEFGFCKKPAEKSFLEIIKK
jgi:hypothetical protein